MADVTVPLVKRREEPVRAAAAVSERFLTLPRAAAVAFVVLFTLAFDDPSVHDDGVVYYSFLRKFFGTHNDGVAYQFGSTVLEAPFYLASQLVATRGQLDHYHAGEIAVAFASGVAMLLCLYFGWLILRDLALPRGPAVLLLTLFGTPLYFYGVFSPSYKHAADALYTTAATWLALRSTRSDDRRYFVGAGVCMGLMLATRYADAAYIGAMLLVFFILRYRRAVAWIAGSAVATTVVVFVLPLLRHIQYSTPPNIYAMARREALASVPIVDPVVSHIHFSAGAPVKMLFTLHRGLFLWTPLTLLAVVGFVWLLRSDRANRAFLAALGAAALALLVVHAFWGGLWDGGGSFSQRFLTALFPFFLVGTAALLRRAPRLGLALAIPCTLFSLFVGLTIYTGYYKGSASDGIDDVIGHFHGLTGKSTTRFHKPPPHDSVQNLGREVGDRLIGRWRVYWRLVA